MVSVTRVVVGVSLLAVAGCGHYEWRRMQPNATNFQQAEYSCQRDSVVAAPVAPVREVERNRREERVTVRDANEHNRESLYYSCMRAHGWARVYIEDKQQPAPQPVAMVTPPPAQAAPAQPAPVQPAPAPQPMASGAFDPSGTWDSDGEKITFRLQAGGVMTATYPDGTISGRLNGRNFEGTWREASGDRACRRTGDGVYWGKVAFQFNADGRTGTGQWGYCDDAARKNWDIKR